MDTVRQGRRPCRTGLHEPFDALIRWAEKKAKLPKLDGGFAADAA